MTTTPRLLNRLVLAAVGLLALVAGSVGILLLTVPGAPRWWRAATQRSGEAIADLRTRTTLEGQADTWLWIALAGVLLVVVALLVLWVAAQGRGRTGLFASVDGRSGQPDGDDGGTPGSVTITAGAVEQALKAALLERPDLAGASVTTWEVRGVPGLRVRVYPKKGSPPYVVAAEVSRLVEALDMVTGYRTPVLISIGSGTRVRFTRAERVR